MALIIKRGNYFTVNYSTTDMNQNILENYYDYQMALRRKKEIEESSSGSLKITKDDDFEYFLNLFVNVSGQKRWRPAKYQSNLGILSHYLSKILSNTRICELTQDKATEIITNLKKLPAVGRRHQEPDKVIPQSMQDMAIVLLRQACNYLVQAELLDMNPFSGLLNYHKRTVQKEKQTWSLAKFEEILTYCIDRKLFLYLHLIFATSLDIRCILALSWKDVHISDNELLNDSCYIETNSKLWRCNLHCLADLDSINIIHQFPSQYGKVTNTALLLYKDSMPPQRVKIPYKLAFILEVFPLSYSCIAARISINSYRFALLEPLS